MSTTKSTSHVSLKSRDTSVMKGIDKHITTSFTIAGTTYTPAELKALFQSEITAIEASDAMRKSLADNVQNVKTVGATVNEAYLLLRGGLITQYGRKANAVLNDFGMEIPKVTGPQTAFVKALAPAGASAANPAKTITRTANRRVSAVLIGACLTREPGRRLVRSGYDAATAARWPPPPGRR